MTVKRAVILYGICGGLLIAALAIVLSFLLVFFGIRSYRENVSGGVLTFGRGFTVGLLITLMSCVFYVAAWQLIYFKLSPGFMEKYARTRSRRRGDPARASASCRRRPARCRRSK
jgi:hypothetical protein